MDFVLGKGHPCTVVYGEDESDAVKIAAENLKKDLKKVFGEKVLGEASETKICIRTVSAAGMHKEQYRIRVRGGMLCIEGSDRRGTIYGIYEISQSIGVSPWYFWADVPVKRKDEYVLPEGFFKEDHPSVEYRGIFINDEEELEAWVKNYMGEETIGVKTYEKVFELLLRLKANYIWPAMHVNSFNVRKENGALAERMGIVVGTSHCDMLMRSNNREWRPWLAKKGYEGVRYDYSRPGRDREILKEYWRESVEQNRDFEVCYTIGMRGIHDSGFETSAFQGLTGEELKAAKIELLQTVMTDQQRLLKDTLGHDTMMTFVPYKEVLPLYDGGLQVPEDVTLVWANDNYGYIRRYPSEKERKRRGGNGIYYHNSYWAPPGMSYVFLCSIPLAHTANELRKAYAEGVRKLWVMNVGVMKPLEQEIEFFLRLAWEIGREDALTEDVDRYVADWIDRNFSGGIGAETAKLLNDFSQLTNMRKVEMMDTDAFSQTAYGDEAAVRIHAYEEMFAKGNALYASLPGEERDAFFQLVLMRIHAAYFTNLAWYYGDRSTLMYDRGNMQAAAEYAGKTREYEDARRRLVIYYNTRLSGGKWNGILNPEGFPPPRAAMMPLCTPPLSAGNACGSLTFGKRGMRVDLWNEADRLTFVRPASKWLEIGNRGEGEIRFRITAPEWVKLSEAEGDVRTERRVAVSVEEVSTDRLGVIVVTDETGGGRIEIPVETVYVPGNSVYIENAGRVSAEDAGIVSAEVGGRKSAEDAGIMSVEDAEQVSAENVGQVSMESAGKVFAEGIGRISAEDAGKVPAEGIGRISAEDAGKAPAEGIGWMSVEDDGIVAVEAGQASCGDFKVIRRLGRGFGALVEACVSREPEQFAGLGGNAGLGSGCPCLGYPVTFTSEGEFTLEIHRFPSLNSTGHIRVGVSVDGGEIQIAETEANDEHRGSWRDNVRNNVDRLCVKLPYLKAGKHCVQFYAVDKYFAFTRFVIYTRERKENNFAAVYDMARADALRGMENELGTGVLTGRAHESGMNDAEEAKIGIKEAAVADDNTVAGGNTVLEAETVRRMQELQRLPREFDGKKFASGFYGEIALKPRLVEYAPLENPRDTLVVADLIRQDEAYAGTVTAEYYLRTGEGVFTEKEDMIRIDAACALAGSENAFADESSWTGNAEKDASADESSWFGSAEKDASADESSWTGSAEKDASADESGRPGSAEKGVPANSGPWRHCSSESFGRSGLAMYVRRSAACCAGAGAYPSLNYRIRCQGGEYVLWLLLKFGMKEEFVFDVGIDGRVLPKEELLSRGNFWRYETEQIYRYLPVARLALPEGEHLLSIYAKAAGLRFDRICLVRGDMLPPMDSEWA